MVSVFDLEGALQRVEGDRELLQELASIYLDEVSQLTVAISRAVEQNDITAASKIAHTIKGASSNFCARAVYDSAWQLEQMRPTNTREEFTAAYNQLLQEAERLNQAIRQEFKI